MVFVNNINHVFETMVIADQVDRQFSADQKQFPADH
jgi:hypothetical protein